MSAEYPLPVFKVIVELGGKRTIAFAISKDGNLGGCGNQVGTRTVTCKRTGSPTETVSGAMATRTTGSWAAAGITASQSKTIIRVYLIVRPPV